MGPSTKTVELTGERNYERWVESRSECASALEAEELLDEVGAVASGSGRSTRSIPRGFLDLPADRNVIDSQIDLIRAAPKKGSSLFQVGEP